METTTTTLNARTSAEVPGLIAELERRHKTAKDIIVPAQAFRLETVEGQARAIIDTGLGAVQPFALSRTAHGQTAEKLGIPAAYYNRMLAERPDLLAENVNSWAATDDRNWLLRLLDGRMRANLSDRYRALDSYDLAFTALKAIRDVDANVHITRATLTDDRFELRAIVPEWEREIDYRKANGEANRGGFGSSRMVPGIYVSNSDTGRGGLNIKPFLLDLVCTNGMVGEHAFTRVHLGQRNEAGYLTQETRDAKDATMWMEVNDLIKTVFDRDQFEALIKAIEGTATEKLEKPVEAVDAVVKHFGMTDEDRQSILNELLSPTDDRDAGRTVLGLINAVTARGKAFEDTDAERATDFEEAGMVLVRAAQPILRGQVLPKAMPLPVA